MILKSIGELGLGIFAWVLLDNHYHILVEITTSEFLGKLINLINGRSSYEINKAEKKKGRKIWYSYWDTCIRTECDYYTRLNYIHSNPLKHGCVDRLDDLASYAYSSYPYYLRLKGEEWCNDISRRFPIVDFTVKYDDY
jgi:putative transposase